MLTMDRDEVELQFSPSRWSHRYGPEEVQQKHLQTVSQASEEARTSIPCELGVRYGSGEKQLLDIFGGNNIPNEAPIFVFIHGGYWQELSRDLYNFCASPLYDAGCRVVVVGYDLAPTVSLPEIIEEIKAAGTYVVDLARRLGSRSIWFAGHSAGGHLVSMLLFSDWLDKVDKDRSLIKGGFLIGGVYDITPLVDTYVNEPLHLTKEIAIKCSPMLCKGNFNNTSKLKIIVAVGEHESPAFKKQSEEYAEVLKHENIDADYLLVPNVDHFDIVEKLVDKSFDLTNKIINLVKNS